MRRRNILLVFLSLIMVTAISSAIGVNAMAEENTPVEYSMGDANLDGTVNTRDVVLIKQSIVGLAELTEQQKVFADVYADGQINTRDVVLIQQSIVGMEVDLGTHKHNFDENGVCVCGYSELHVHEYTELKNDETNHWYECVCGDKKDIEAHVPSAEATETTDQICTICNRVLTPALGHIHTKHLTKVEATQSTCVKTGNIEHYVCSCEKWFTDNTA